MESLHTRDTVNSCAVAATSRPNAEAITPLKGLLREYRQASKEFENVLDDIGERELEMGDDAFIAAEAAAREPHDDAREALIEAPVTSLNDIATKLRFYFEVGCGDVDPSSWESRIVANVLRDLRKAHPAALAIRRPASTIDYEADLKQAIGAIRARLVKGRLDIELEKGANVHDLLVPVIGSYNVEDCCTLHGVAGAAYDEADAFTFEALFHLRTELEDFASVARATGPACAAARAALNEREDELGNKCARRLKTAICRDIESLLKGKFGRPDRFGGSAWERRL